MKVFILCGGFGTRLDEKGKLIAKTMIKINGLPLIIHILKNFLHQGFNEFVLCGGHKIDTINNFFLSKTKNIIFKNKNHTSLNFILDKKKTKIDIINTGKKTGTGGRIKLAFKKLKLNEDFLATYGDGLSNVPINKLIKFHYSNKSDLTLTAVRPKQRYGILRLEKNKVKFFDNSKKKSEIYINRAFFVISKKVIKLINNEKIYLENQPFKSILKKGKLFSFKHDGFWASMDTLKDKVDLDKIAKKSKKLPWRIK